VVLSINGGGTLNGASLISLANLRLEGKRYRIYRPDPLLGADGKGDRGRDKKTEKGVSAGWFACSAVTDFDNQPGKATGEFTKLTRSGREGNLGKNGIYYQW